MVARWAHNSEAVGSSPSSATNSPSNSRLKFQKNHPIKLIMKRLWKASPGECYVFICPGCRCGHELTVNWDPKRKASWELEFKRQAPVWSFNGSLEMPTFSPSLLVHWTGPGGGKKVCHSFIKDGFIEFLSDCTHEFAGKTLPLPFVDLVD